MEQEKKDNEIASFFQSSSISHKYSWQNSSIIGTEHAANPFNSVKVKNFLSKAEFKDKKILKMFSDDFFTLKFSDDIQKPIFNLRQKNRQILFKKEVDTSLSVPMPNKDIVFSPAASFFYGISKQQAPFFQHPVLDGYKIRDSQLFTVSLFKFETKGCDFFEPITCTAFLFSDKRIISEFWNFVPDPSVPLLERLGFLSKVNKNHNSAFHYRSFNTDTLLVIIINRIAQSKRGLACDKLYVKNNSANLKLATESLSESINNLYQPIGVTFSPIAEILAASSDGFEMPPPCEIDFSKNSLSDIVDIYKNAQKYPFQISLKAQVRSLQDPSMLTQEGFIELQSILQQPSEPLLQFNNKMVVSLVSASFLKKPGKDVYCAFSYRKGGIKGEKLAVINSKISGENVSEVLSFCSQGDKSIDFVDQFVIDLPPEVSEDTTIVFEFYSARFNKGSPELVGMAYLPLSSTAGITKNGKKKLTIHQPTANVGDSSPFGDSEWEANNLQNAAVISIQLMSSITFNDARLNDFFKGENPDLTFVHPILLLRHLFQIVDELTNRINQTPVKVIHTFETLARLVNQVYEKFEDFLVFCALNFALKNKVAVHIALLDAWGDALSEDASKSGSQRFDVYLADFFFLLIIKSLYISKDKDIQQPIMKFVSKWSTSISPLVDSGFIQSKKFCKSYANFLTMLAEVGFYSIAVDCVLIQVKAFGNSQNDHQVLIYFLESVLTPKFFTGAVIHFDSFCELIVGLVQKVRDTIDSIPLQDLFDVLLNVVSYFDLETSQAITDRLLDCLTPLCPISAIPFTDEDDIKSSMVFFVFLIGNATKDSFKKWWPKAKKPLFFDSIHFLLDKIKISQTNEKPNSARGLEAIEKAYSSRSRANTAFNSGSARSFISAHKSIKEQKEAPEDLAKRQSEIVYSMQFSILNIIKIISEIDIDDQETVYSPNRPLTTFSQITKVVYHLMCSNFAIDTTQNFGSLINSLAKNRIKQLFRQCCPVLPKFLVKLIQISEFDRNLLSFIDAVHGADDLFYKNTNRSMAIFIRTLYFVPYEMLNCIRNEFLLDYVTNLSAIETVLHNEPIDFESHCDVLYQKSELMKLSPDSQYEVLSELAKLEHTEEYYAEEIQVMLLQAALVIEYLTLFGKVPKDLFSVEHAARVFEKLCPSFVDIICSISKNEDLPRIPSFCDSPPFTFFSLIKLLKSIIDICNETRYFEISGELIDLVWPLLENRRANFLLETILKNQSISFRSLSKIKPDEDRLFGLYFRISFFGKQFGKNDGLAFIYREKKLTHLYEVSSRILGRFQKLYGQTTIELIKESGAVDVSKLDPAKGYVQVTFVEPFGTNYSQFYFDTPFVKGNQSKAQGTVDQQWLRRNLLIVDRVMPTVVKRQKVTCVRPMEIEPIRVSYRQLRERVNMLRNAIEAKDMRKVQQLLHGSLLVQVNEGPSKMAEVFLAEGCVETKYTQKMRNEFRDFLVVNNEGLKLHAKHCGENTEFIPLQHELESGFETLSEKLKAYLK